MWYWFTALSPMVPVGRKVIPLLQAKGYNVIAVQNPLTSLADDVAAAKRAIALMDGPVLLVAHSYGGMVISEAGNDPKVAGLVYVAALVPEEGQNANDVNASMPTTGVEKEFRVSPEGFVSLSMKAVNENFVPDASPVERKLVFATQVPLAAIAGEEKVQSPAWKTKPSWFIVAAQDGVINPDLERYKAKLIKATTIELTSGHVPMISQPNKVADLSLGQRSNYKASKLRQLPLFQLHKVSAYLNAFVRTKAFSETTILLLHIKTSYMLPIGIIAPDFELFSTPDQKLMLSDLRNKKIVLAFYPADWSPVCGDQIDLYNEMQKYFAKHNAQLVGISVDSKWSHLAFSEHNQFHFPLLADFEPKGAVARLYEAYNEKEGECRRALYVIDEKRTTLLLALFISRWNKSRGRRNTKCPGTIR